jgi:uracil-DNA glycosylase
MAIGGELTLRIPESLADLGRKRMEKFQVEGFVYGTGPTRAKLMLVGEAPGETEIQNGIPFSGRAGQELMKFLQIAGVTREEIYITSAVRSRPFKWVDKRDRNGELITRKYNRPPTAGEIIAHAPILDYEVQHVKTPVIVPMGNIGLKRLAGFNQSITGVHGTFLNQPVQRLKLDGTDKFEWSEQNYILYPIFHPASVFYNPALRPLIHADMLKLKEWLEASGNHVDH